MTDSSRLRPVTRFRLAATLALTCALLSLGGAGAAHAQGAAPTPVLPTVVDIHTVKPGAWAQYVMTLPNGKMNYRMAVVGRDENATKMEVMVEGGPAAALGPVVMQLDVPRDPKQGGKPSAVVLQLGNNGPMQLPPDHPMTPKDALERVDPKRLKGKPESVKVPAGTFTAQRHTQAQEGGKATAWLSEKVPPLGLVRMESATPMGPVTVELVKQGQGAKSSLNGKPAPFDQNLFMKQLMSGMSGAQGAGRR